MDKMRPRGNDEIVTQNPAAPRPDPGQGDHEPRPCQHEQGPFDRARPHFQPSLGRVETVAGFFRIAGTFGVFREQMAPGKDSIVEI